MCCTRKDNPEISVTFIHIKWLPNVMLKAHSEKLSSLCFLCFLCLCKSCMENIHKESLVVCSLFAQRLYLSYTDTYYISTGWTRTFCFHFCFILQTKKGSQREVRILGFPTRLDKVQCQGLFRPQAQCTPTAQLLTLNQRRVNNQCYQI